MRSGHFSLVEWKKKKSLITVITTKSLFTLSFKQWKRKVGLLVSSWMEQHTHTHGTLTHMPTNTHTAYTHAQACRFMDRHWLVDTHDSSLRYTHVYPNTNTHATRSGEQQNLIFHLSFFLEASFPSSLWAMWLVSGSESDVWSLCLHVLYLLFVFLSCCVPSWASTKPSTLFFYQALIKSLVEWMSSSQV